MALVPSLFDMRAVFEYGLLCVSTFEYKLSLVQQTFT